VVTTQSIKLYKLLKIHTLYFLHIVYTMPITNTHSVLEHLHFNISNSNIMFTHARALDRAK